MRRLLVIVGCALSWLVVTAAPASAHTVSGVGATNYRSSLTSVSPQTPGLQVRVVELGSRLELVNRTDADVIVLGYQGEPYLRVGAAGVFENLRSVATYVNQNLQGNAPVPAEAQQAGPQTPPRWKQLSGGDVVRWHDHRIHWMGNQPPPVVRQTPDRPHVISDWVVTLELHKPGSQPSRTPVQVRGQLAWMPGPSPLPWVALVVVLLVPGVVAGLSQRWATLLAALVAVIVVIDVIHATGVAFASAGTVWAQISRVVTGSFLSVGGWAAGAWAFVMLMRRNPDGLFGAAFAGLVVALLGGVNDIGVLARSQVPFAWGDTLARITVAVSLGLGVSVVAGSALALRRSPRPTSSSEPASPNAEPAPRPALG